MNRYIILIPTHRANLTSDEQQSVRRVLQLCPEAEVRFVVPESMARVEDFPDVSVDHFEDEYFRSLHGYNRLMMAADFYARYTDYEYLLICQTDAFLFRNEIANWCRRGYRYVGAPWLIKRKYHGIGRGLLYLRSLPHRLQGRPFLPLDFGGKVGNGGFSLRRVEDFLRICREQKEEIARWIALSQTWSEYNEDCFWATRPEWTYPTAGEALSFAMDLDPEDALRQADGQLPMAAHGWTKPACHPFWEPIIRRETATSAWGYTAPTRDNSAAVVVWYHPTPQQKQNTDLLREAVGQVYVEDNSEVNSGIAAALNRGIRRAIADGYQWVLTMDQDSVMTAEQMKAYYAEIDACPFKHEVGVFSVTQDTGARKKNRPRYWERTAVMCSGNMLPAGAIQRVGTMREELFIDLVDDDFCLRMQRAGFRVVELTHIPMEHHLGEGRRQTRILCHEYVEHAPQRHYYITRNTLILQRDYPEVRRLYRAKLRQHIKRVLLYDHTDKWEKLRAIIRGWQAYRRGKTGVADSSR